MRVALVCVGVAASSSALVAPEIAGAECLAPPGIGRAEGTLPGVATRVVSLNPSLTAVLVAIGAQSTIVGVDAYSARLVPALSSLPQVGGLYDPSLEAIVGLRPDLVVLVPSAEQRDVRSRLAELGVPVLALDPITYDDVAQAIVALGRCAGREAEATTRATALRTARHRVREAAAGRPRPRVVLVLQRDPLFVASGGTFLDEMLDAAGAENVARALPGPYPRASMEWLVAAAPDLLLDASGEPGEPEPYWSRWASLPAVIRHQVVTLDADRVTLPGPELDRALELLAHAVDRARSSLPGSP